MTIRTDALRASALKARAGGPRTLNEAKVQGVKTAFLCHSHRDAELAKGLVNMLSEAGWRVYID